MGPNDSGSLAATTLTTGLEVLFLFGLRVPDALDLVRPAQGLDLGVPLSWIESQRDVPFRIADGEVSQQTDEPHLVLCGRRGRWPETGSSDGRCSLRGHRTPACGR